MTGGPARVARNQALRVVVAAVAMVASLAAAELALRRSVPQWSTIYPPVNFRPDLFEAASFGYRLVPGGPRPYAYPRANPRTVAVHANPEGFRARRPIAEPDLRPRVLVVGDSMVFGQGVEEEERFTERLETSRPDWRVDNLGMVGFGVDLMLRSLEQVGLAEPPAAVVLCVYTDDLRRAASTYTGMGFPLPKYVLDGGELRTVPYPEPRPWERLLLYQGMRYAALRYTPAIFPLNAAILDRFAALAHDWGFALVVAYLPSPAEAWDDRMRRDFVAGWANGRGVAFLDLGDAIARDGGRDLYIAGDPHWNPAGHAVVARELQRFLETQVPALGVAREG
jgi:hypothetical protein